MASRAAAASDVEASLSSLSSDLLIKVANYLNVKELCVFDKATASNKQLRAKYLFSLFNDSFLYPGADVKEETSSEWQQGFAQWLTMRHVFVKSITLNEQTTPSVLHDYDTMNRVNPGLESLTIIGDVDFPKDIVVRSNKTLHKVSIRNYGTSGTEQLRKLMGSVREWGSMGGSLQELWLENCDFGNEAVDFGCSCDALTDLCIWNCYSGLSTTPGDSLDCTCFLWGILPKCKNLKKFTKISFFATGVEPPLNARDLCLLAKFCPDLTYLYLNSMYGTVDEAALVSVAMKCTKLQILRLFVQTALTDRTIEAIAANLVSLRKLEISNLELHKPRTLRVLAHGCPQLSRLYIDEGNALVTETELLYLVKNAKELRTLEIGKWEHLDLRETWEELEPDDSAADELLQLGMEDSEALLSLQQDRLQVLRAATQQQGDTVDRLLAASSNPHFKIELSVVGSW
ncbi:hypothetical protein B484DRAFT_456604 [Ochromonadaceae sp. CCMP2298]|nr:hypothetical protein B484DRAFT_456604 [Ochromonadaceae sp. CCMP2298]|eukprot:CAMPEP_0173225836 /NCGR_PEP_ID=MMETSP1142-20121109/5092_1 /TAXON_ID=483371 /ORGANISM="non described non described, Strain CCMP2298" /LENGTH=457 /DNA_ID=CAMNT_0014154211 /DNA_START=22 /DNA_END=1395 /DNA_ORIENTATION=-